MWRLGYEIPVVSIVAIELRDLWQRGTWESDGQVGLNVYNTGDFVLIANRWWALPGYQWKLYSLTSKLLMKTAWDDCGVIVKGEKGEPHILICEYDRVVCEPLIPYLAERAPRGAAVRTVMSLEERPTLGDLREWIENQKRKTPTPWTMFKVAAYDSTEEAEQYRWAVEASNAAWNYRRKQVDGASLQAMEESKQIFLDANLMAEERAKLLSPHPPNLLFNSSLVAELAQRAKVLVSGSPKSTKYAPPDFAFPLPLLNAKASTPLVVWKT